MKLLLTIGLIQGACLAMSFVGLMLVRECKDYLDSPTWLHKQASWVLLVAYQAVMLAGTYAGLHQIKWIDALSSTVYLLSISGFVNSYRILLKNLEMIPKEEGGISAS